MSDSAAPDWYIFTDESGREEAHQYVVIAALIGWMPGHIFAAERLHHQYMQTVPGLLRPNFVPHAYEIQHERGSKTIRELWSGKDRFRFLCNMMAVPRLSGMGIAWAVEPHNRVFQPRPGYTRKQILHGSAFADCMATADQYIRDVAGPNARAQIFAEDIPEMRRSLVLVHRLLQMRTRHIRPDEVVSSYSLHHGDGTKVGVEHRVVVANRPIQFGNRKAIALLQIADFVAYGLLRHLRRLSGGDAFARAILGDDRKLEPPDDCTLVGAVGPIPTRTPYPNPIRMTIKFGGL